MKEDMQEGAGHLWEEMEGAIHEAGGYADFSLARFHEGAERAFRRAGFRAARREGAQSILVLRTDAMGDNILTTPVLRELRRNLPDAHIALVTSPAAYPLLEVCPYVDEVHSFRLPKHRQEGMGFLKKIARFCRDALWQEWYDLSISPCWGSKPTEERFLAYLSGARERWGYSDLVNNLYMPESIQPEEEGLLLTHAVVNPPEIIREVDRYLYLLEAMGMRVASRKPELWLTSKDRQRGRELLGSFGEDGCRIALSTGIGPAGGGRKYPADQWLRAMKEIFRLGGRFVLLGGKDERADGEFLRAVLPEGYLLDLTGKTSLRESLAVISLSDLFMGNDTGIMHGAAACGIPVIAVFREALDKEGVCPGVLSEFRRFAPYAENAIVLRPEHALAPCRDALCYGGCLFGHAHCIAQVPPEKVTEAFQRMLVAGIRRRKE